MENRAPEASTPTAVPPGGGGPPAGRIFTALRSAAVAAASLAVPLALAALASCGSPPSSYTPGQRPHTVPIMESKRERAGHITYRLASLRQEGERVTIDLDLTNGFGRSLLSVTLWMDLLGPEGQRHLIRHPVGPVGEHRTERVFALAEEVPFQVEELMVSVQVN